MNTTLIQTMKVPSARELFEGLIAFYTVSAGVACVRAEQYGPHRFSLIAEQLATTFATKLTIDDAQEVISDFDEKSVIALATIYEELAYLAKRYEYCGRQINEQWVMPELAEAYEDEEGDPLVAAAVQEIDVVKGSLNFVLEKLPKWLQKALDVLMEVLKLSRGET